MNTNSISCLRRYSVPCLKSPTLWGPDFWRYKGQRVGEYVADILVKDVLVIELKCVDRLANEHLAQCLNYLRASGRAICMRRASDLRSSALISGRNDFGSMLRDEQQQSEDHHGNQRHRDVEQDLPRERRAAMLPVAQLGPVGHTHLIQML